MNNATGQMYEWVDKTFNPLNGRCPHRCGYCLTARTAAGRMGYYDGELRLNQNKMKENLGKGRTVFVCNLNDLFADAVPDKFICDILGKCRKYPDNTYVFQSKNPARFKDFTNLMPISIVLLTTIETNRENDLGKSPTRKNRMEAMVELI